MDSKEEKNYNHNELCMVYIGLININSKRVFRIYVKQLEEKLEGQFGSSEPNMLLHILGLYMSIKGIDNHIDIERNEETDELFILSLLNKIATSTNKMDIYLAYSILYPYAIEDNVLMHIVVEFLVSNIDRINYNVRYKIICMFLYEDDNLFDSSICFSDEENALREKIYLSGPYAKVIGSDDEKLVIRNTVYHDLCTISIPKQEIAVYVLSLYMKSKHELANSIIEVLSLDEKHQIMQGAIDYDLRESLSCEALICIFEIKDNKLYIAGPINLNLISLDMYDFIINNTSLQIDEKIAVHVLVKYVAFYGGFPYLKNKFPDQVIKIAYEQDFLFRMLSKTQNVE
jgi:hypothetical protein